MDVSKFCAGATGELDWVRRAIVLELFSSVVRYTPVLTGRLRGDWQATVESPALGVVPARGGAAPKTVPAEVLAKIIAACAEIAGNDKPAILRNNLPYAHRIEFDGWSKIKAPAGMVRINMARVQGIVAAKIQEAQR